MINQLLAAKEKEYFKLEEWEERGLNPSDDARQQEMRCVVNQFIDLIIEKIETKTTIDENDIFDIIEEVEDGDYIRFDTEEREWVSEVCINIATDLGFDSAKIDEKYKSIFLSETCDMLLNFQNAGFSSDNPLVIMTKNALVMQLKMNNEPIENIIKITGLTEEEINKLIE